MGRSYWFECSKCGYRAKVSGGTDRGLNVFVQTVACRDCRELYDAVTRARIADESEAPGGVGGWRRFKWMWRFRRREFSRPPSFQAALNRLAYTGVKRFMWVHFKPQCPVSAIHRVESWNEPDKCPKCGTYLEKNAVPYRIWE